MEELAKELLPVAFSASSSSVISKVGMNASMGTLIDNFRKLITKYGCDQSAALLEAAEKAYNQLCKLVDIPYVPEMIEVRLESAIWSVWLKPSLVRIIAEACKK
jgi:hypothetical protein